MRRAWVLALAVAACADSSITQDVPLRIDDIAPRRISARGGEIRIRGTGFGASPRVWVRDEPVDVLVEDGALSLDVRPLVAGSAALRVESDGATVRVEDALVVEPLALAFAEAEAWHLPSIPPVTALDASGSDAIAGTHDGLFVLAAGASGGLEATPIPLAPAQEEPPSEAPREPAVRAFAADPATARLAACVDDAVQPLRIVDTSAEAPALVTIEASAACARVAFLRAGADRPPWLVASTAAGVVAWKPGDAGFVPADLRSPTTPGDIDAWLVTDLDRDGDDDLLVAGRASTGPWLVALVLSEVLDRGPTLTLDEAFPAPRQAIRALAAFDADHDGDLDVFAGGEGHDALYVNDGSGRFFDDAWRLLPFERTSGRGVAAADLDLDGFTDLVIATADGPDRLFAGSPGAFTDRTPALGLGGAIGTGSVALVDVDGDGDRDVLTASLSGALRLRVLVEPAEDP